MSEETAHWFLKATYRQTGASAIRRMVKGSRRCGAIRTMSGGHSR